MVSKGFVIMSVFIPAELMAVFLTCGKSCLSKCNNGQFSKMEQGAVIINRQSLAHCGNFLDK